MKTIYGFILLVLLSINGFAAFVPTDKARLAGFNYLSQKGNTTPQNADQLQLIYTSGGEEALFYVFGADHSFVIVAADDAVTPVLGYSLDNPFNAAKMPDNVKGFLSGMDEQISYVKAHNIAAVEGITVQWEALANGQPIRTASKTTAVSPLMSTTWDQSPYYNANCPYDYSGGGRSVAGCVATATAQVMKFWRWPVTGTGFHSYSTSSYGTLSANFSSHTYNWSAMPNHVTAANSEVAQLLSDVGISVDMNYSASSSGAYVISATSAVTNCSEYALKTYFNYDASLRGYRRASYSDATWIGMLKADLNAGRPIIYDGFGTGGGHCFVLDGFDASDNFHVNWGWGGYCDGYFAISALNPSGTGTGGGSGGYNSGQEAILGVHPAGSGGGGGGGSSDTLALYSPIYLSATTINYASAFTVTTNIGNFGSTSFSGDYCAAAFDYTTGGFVCFIDSIMGATLPSGYSSGSLTFSTTGLLPMLPGNYYIGVYYRRSGGGWQAVWDYGSYSNFVTMSVVNHNPIELVTAIAATPTTLVQGAAASVSVNLGNYASSAYSGSYDVSLYNLDGSFNSTIQTLSGMSLPAGSMYSSPLTFSTTSITATPGSYILAVTYSVGSSWYLCGADYFTNPVYINVVAPAPLPDMYEVNNTAATAYNLPLTFTSNVAVKSTTGSNFHTNTDHDYYKIVLPSGYNYTVTARINDAVSSDDATAYTVDANWTYSTDGGTTWSAVYTDVMSGGTGTINLTGGAGGTVIFHVAAAYSGSLGKYLLKLSNVTRSAVAATTDIEAEKIKVFPNPATEFVTVDMGNSSLQATSLTITDAAGKVVSTQAAAGNANFNVQVGNLANGTYFLNINTSEGEIRKMITVNR